MNKPNVNLRSAFLMTAMAAILLIPCIATGETGAAAEIARVGDAWTDAIRNGDANAAAAVLTEDVAFVNQTTGVRLRGRDAIITMLKEVFAKNSAFAVERKTTGEPFISKDVAIENGTSRFAADNRQIERTADVTVYVLRGGKWKIHRIWQTDLPVNSHYEHLADLSWMIGEWNKKTDGKTTRNVCRWTRNRNFITRTFEITGGEGPDVKGTEVIGWDPSQQTIRSWTFDSTGGIAEGQWVLKGDDWRMDTLTDRKPADLAKHKEALSKLKWLIGRWVDADDQDTVELNCEWSPGEAFLVMRFKAEIKDEQGAQEGVMVIGYEGEGGRIRSYLFDTDGGFAEAVWTQTDKGWEAKTRHVLSDGRRASSVAMYRQVDDNKFTWRRVNQELDGELLPNMPETTVVRKTVGD